MIKQISNSKVVFAGAGPGDPDLITVKALKYLQAADVVVVDRLVDQSLLSQTKLGAKIFFVGKEAGNSNSFAQGAINELLISEARIANVVLRLKGGDVSFFSNLLSELESLVENNIPFEIIPGVTAASGAAAYAGIPLTARGYASSVRFLAYTHPELVEESQIKELASTDDTLVFYMSSKTLPNLVERLLKKNISSEKWVAVVEQASTPFQKTVAAPVNEFLATQGRHFKSPSIVIIGKVAKLYSKFGWFNSVMDGENFFPSASGHYLTTAKVA
jgi:uroporphyrin-III C-methyltransferase/precorrin-2 dehydrogenase/sirohydrochlorin ferrochelatase/uroporphyrin-III C-methyltransferase